MQHIGMRRESERGELLAEFERDGVDVRVAERAPASSVCLRYIDPYGDTVFNQLQVPVLISELEGLRAMVGEHDLRNNIDKVLAFLRASKEPHVYIRLLGD
jgi:hypothetical protein